MASNSYKPVLADEVVESIGKVKIADVRPESYYVEGHIPTAIDVPFDKMAAADGDLDANIVKAFKDAGINEGDDVIVYCQVGYHSKLASDALHDAGYKNLKYYPGSFEDWVLDSNRPVEK